jgi:hypothetical protein
MKCIVSILAACGLVMVVGCKRVTVEADAPEPPKTAGENIQAGETDSGRWLVHDTKRPAPTVVTPGTEPGKAPSDAIILFDGTDLSQWQPTKWVIRDGILESVEKAGYIKTKDSFGSCQLHVEFATPENVKGNSQGRGNSGVFLQDEYEIQVLDSYDNATYPDGQCAALYGRAVPLVNASAKPGQWQSYDIIFHRPVFEGESVVRKATFTVLQNGVLVQDHVVLAGGTQWKGAHAVSEYKAHEDKRPIALQDHGNPVRYRNIWIRELDD